MNDEVSESQEPQEISGVVEKIVYRSEETGYTVCSIAVTGRGQPGLPVLSSARQDAGLPGIDAHPGGDFVTVVGTCGAVWVGENLRAKGKWTHHRKHGYQFQAESITCVAPVSVEGIRMFLSSGLIKGVGDKMAERIVARFGEDTLRIIEKESKRLEEVSGIGPKTRDKIRNSWTAHKAVRDIMIFLRAHGVGTAQATRIYRQYGDQAVAVVTDNPYRLCREVWGIGFKSADKIAMSLGVPRESAVRARAGVLYALQTMAEEGHCFCPREALLEDGQALLEIPTAVLDEAIEHEIKSGDLVAEEGNIYLALLHEAEVDVAARMKDLLAADRGFPPIDADKALPWAQARMRITFDPVQSDALKIALTEKVSIITGGPGVGKTTIIRALVDVFARRKLKVHLAAPTGRAAKRLSEATGAQAKTIHRLLKFVPTLSAFEHCAANPLDGDVFILDEVSMIDVLLMRSFLSALKPTSHLVLVGDSDQLPSVGPGNVLKDILASGAVPSRRLETIFRQQTRSSIVQNAHLVNRGEPLELARGDADSDFYFIAGDDPDDVIAKMLQLVTKRIPERFGLDPLRDVQVLTPMRRNQLGADNLNAILQQAFNPSGQSVSRFGRDYRVGDRVMQIRNNYDREVFNGDIGILSDVDEEEQTVSVNFDGREVEYEYADLDELVLAYACSIHKSQGSEYPAAVILMTTHHYRMLQRNLLYTAITRGRRLVCLVGSHRAIQMAIRNNTTIMRRTSLARRLQAGGVAP